MTIWAIADIHASPVDGSGRPLKPMDVFGAEWTDHLGRIEQAWNMLVEAGDTVIVAGDLDWSMRPEEAVPTLRRLAQWKGRKILIRGNHDYWWSSDATNKVRRLLPDTVELLHNNACEAEGFAIVGCKGSPVPGGLDWTETDAKLLNREVQRLKLSLAAAGAGLPAIAALHYPPAFASRLDTPYTEIFHAAGNVRLCVYGHLHGVRARAAIEGEVDGVRYRLVAADHVDFSPVPVAAGGRISCSP